MKTFLGGLLFGLILAGGGYWFLTQSGVNRGSHPAEESKPAQDKVTPLASRLPAASVENLVAVNSTEWWGLRPVPKPSASGEEPPLPSYNRQWAVIIGVNAYTDKRADDLEFAHNDARAIRDILFSDFGYKADSILYLTAVREGGLKDGPAVQAKDSGTKKLGKLTTGLANWQP